MYQWLSRKNQIVLPKGVRKALGLKAGDPLLLVLKGDAVILLRKPKRPAAAIRGLADGLYSSSFLAEEGDSWQ